ncbi:zinc ribbon domain-containing protein [Streptomyces sp. NPDC059866]|uniref:zinc ribbon domain-containing protein n=1 Tax=Streptomyces sp. NPDC059866 TaxID=3346978 RepID=UPI0036661FCE
MGHGKTNRRQGDAASADDHPTGFTHKESDRTDEQAAGLSRTFGCVRLVCNKALEKRAPAWYFEQRRISYAESSAALTEGKKTGELAEPLDIRWSRSLRDASWTELRSTLEYKCAWYGRELVVIDRWFPSSKLCGNCGTVRERLPLDVRTWTCDCGTVHDRDVNAARTILAAGPAASACGDGVRPQRESSRTGQSSVKQEARRATAGIPRLSAGEEVKSHP